MGLEASPQMAIRLVYQVQDMFQSVDKRHVRSCGMPLDTPRDMELDLNLFSRLQHRHETGDFRHTLDELQAMERVAAWLCEVNNTLVMHANETNKIFGGH